MIWKIAKKEFLLNLMMFKFAVGTILCVVLMAVFMPVLVNDYQQRLKNYNANVTANEAELRKAKAYGSITPTIYQSPAVLSIFSEGIEKQINNSARIELGSVPEIGAVSAEVNPYLSIFPTLDVSLIFKIIISVLSILVAYDVISGEREQGTLKLMLSGIVARYQVLLGKLLAGLMTLTVPATIAFIVGLLILQFSPMIDLTGSDWIRIGLMYVVSLIFISAMYNFGLFFSCLTKRSAISLMFVLLFWVIFLIVIPNGSLFLAGKFQPVESRGKIDGQIKSILEKKENELDASGKNSRGGSVWSMTRDAFGNRYTQLCNMRWMETSQKYYAFIEPLNIKYADKIWEVQHSYLRKLYDQKNLANNISRVSPVCLYKNIMSALAGTDLASTQSFTKNVREYRNKVVDYISSKTDNFYLPSYFTQATKEDCMIYEKYNRAQNEDDKKNAMSAFENVQEKLIKNPTALNLQDFPQFSCRPEGIIKSLQKTVYDLGLLFVMNVLFFVLSFVAFAKYDVR